MSKNTDSSNNIFARHKSKFLVTFLAVLTTAGLVAWLTRSPKSKVVELDDSTEDNYDFNPAV